jgi:hypothetical protein
MNPGPVWTAAWRHREERERSRETVEIVTGLAKASLTAGWRRRPRRRPESIGVGESISQRFLHGPDSGV